MASTRSAPGWTKSRPWPVTVALLAALLLAAAAVEAGQPFTRDERIRVPAGVRVVVVEAHDKVHGLGGRTITVDLGRASGPGYTVRPRR